LLSRVYRYPVEVLDHPGTGAQLVLPARPARGRGVTAAEGPVIPAARRVSARPGSAASG
jgi:iron complex transport system ATP-binding protein